MTKDDLEAVFDRVRAWPPERQEDAARMLIAMEAQGTGVYELSPEETADLEEALAEMDRGEVATDEEVATIFNRYKSK